MISVVICTYNRCESLKDTLDSLLQQECCGNFDYEIIVIDNNSIDKTKELIENNISRFQGRLRYVFEEKQGVSYARNRGVNEAKGEVVAFIDDDCLAERKWIAHIRETFNEYNADCVGGRILPLWRAEKPIWLTNKFYRNLALLDHGNKPFRISENRYKCYTANLAFRREMFYEYGPFQTNIGRKADRLFGGEDIAFIDTLFENKAAIIYQPNIIVYHKIPRERMKKKYFRKWHFDGGISSAYTDGAVQAKRTIFDIPRYRLRLFLESLCAYFSLLLSGNSDYFYYECRSILHFSFLLEKIKKAI